MMTIGSLFAGIGGLERGLEAAIPEARTIWQVEQDPYARRVLAKHWPEADRSITDVRQVTRETVERPDLLVGGFPCPGFSSAGLGKGFEDERSGLWGEFARIIGDVRPRKYLVLENVAALCRGQWLGTILADLVASGWLGGCVWDCIPAAAVGAPHRRDRWFCIAWAKVADPECDGRIESSQVAHRGNLSVSAMLGRNGRGGPFSRWITDSGSWSAQPGLGSPADGITSGLSRRVADWERDVPRTVAGKVPDRIAKLRCLGNAVVPQVAEVLGRVINQLEVAR